MNIKLASKIQYDSIVDGEGIRIVIWTQGCPHKCLGCHNEKTHDFNGGFVTSTNEIIDEIKDSIKYHDGITLSGGEPFMQSEALLELALFAKENNKNVWSYSGFKYEELIKMSKSNSNIMKLLENIDVLVDGKFEIDKMSLDLYYKGSKNQRVIDVKKSLLSKKVVLVEKYKGNKTINKEQKDKCMFI